VLRNSTKGRKISTAPPPPPPPPPPPKALFSGKKWIFKKAHYGTAVWATIGAIAAPIPN